MIIHAVIKETNPEMWRVEDWYFTEKSYAQIGKFGCNKMIIAGHIHTSEIAKNEYFHDIYYDGQSHIYIDGDVLTCYTIPVLMIDVEANTYYKVDEFGEIPLMPYSKDEDFIKN